jgi:hypothetical protein
MREMIGMLYNDNDTSTNEPVVADDSDNYSGGQEIV